MSRVEILQKMQLVIQEQMGKEDIDFNRSYQIR